MATETKTRNNGAGSPDAVERLPSIDELIGVDEKAETLATAAANVALLARRLDHQRVGNQETDSDPLRGYASEPDGDYTADEGEELGNGVVAKAGQRFRTYGQQRKRCEKAFADYMRQASDEENLGKVKELTKQKVAEALDQEAKMREAQIANAGNPE